MRELVDTSLLAERLRVFAAERDWEQFHTPKNLAMALAGEAGELLALLQWLTNDEITTQLRDAHFRTAFEDEIADVLIYLVRLADIAGTDLNAAVASKMTKNAERYSVDRSKGSAEKAP
ncbi:nucleotide pyrophosphohydrolase [bacterium]|nr:nucleotide pyrophosphohydrolase [bacterium]MDB2392596.1 nucleotide pyrophosphohydrolase [Acidimicrobiaceae bacterium]